MKLPHDNQRVHWLASSLADLCVIFLVWSEVDGLFFRMLSNNKGRPRPEVSWWLDNKLVDHTFIGTSENVVQNVLVMPQLQRHHLHAILRCQASNYFGVRNNTPTPQLVIDSYGHYNRQKQNTIISSVQLDLNCKWFIPIFQVPTTSLIFRCLLTMPPNGLVSIAGHKQCCCPSHRLRSYKFKRRFKGWHLILFEFDMTVELCTELQIKSVDSYHCHSASKYS